MASKNISQLQLNRKISEAMVKIQNSEDTYDIGFAVGLMTAAMYMNLDQQDRYI